MRLIVQGQATGLDTEVRNLDNFTDGDEKSVSLEDENVLPVSTWGVTFYSDKALSTGPRLALPWHYFCLETFCAHIRDNETGQDREMDKVPAGKALCLRPGWLHPGGGNHGDDGHRFDDDLNVRRSDVRVRHCAVVTGRPAGDADIDAEDGINPPLHLEFAHELPDYI
jgi:hypothetical protein